MDRSAEGIGKLDKSHLLTGFFCARLRNYVIRFCEPKKKETFKVYTSLCSL